jgi:hypothetical protein
MGFFVPILDQSSRLTCTICGQTSRGGVSRFQGGRTVGYLCHTCAENGGCSVVLPWQPGNPLPVKLRVNAWPVFAICLTAIATAAVVLILNGLVGTALRTILLFAARV